MPGQEHEQVQDALQHVLHIAELPEDGSQAMRDTLFHQQSQDPCTWAIPYESIYLRVWDFRRQRFNYQAQQRGLFTNHNAI